MSRKAIILTVFFTITMVCVAALQFWTLRRLQDESADLVRISSDKLRISAWINNYQTEGFARTLELVTTDSAERAKLLDEIQNLAVKNDAAIKAYSEKLPETASNTKLKIKNLIEKRQQYRAIRSQVIELVKQDHKAAALELVQNSLHQTYTAYSEAGDELLNADSESVKSHAALVTKFCSLTLYLVPAIGLLGFIVGVMALVISFMYMAKGIQDHI